MNNSVLVEAVLSCLILENPLLQNFSENLDGGSSMPTLFVMICVLVRVQKESRYDGNDCCTFAMKETLIAAFSISITTYVLACIIAIYCIIQTVNMRGFYQKK